MSDINTTKSYHTFWVCRYRGATVAEAIVLMRQVSADETLGVGTGVPMTRLGRS